VKDLVAYIVRPLVAQPEAVHTSAVEGEASVMLELRVHPDDVPAVRGERGETLRAIQQVLSIAGGTRKPVLDFVDDGASSGEE
jgi:predicted RNA-binding protein YlqC (UPF0109 family)